MIVNKWFVVPSLCMALGLAFSTPTFAAGKSKKHSKPKSSPALVPVMSKEVTISKRKVTSSHSGKLVANSKTVHHRVHRKHSSKKHTVNA